jgi:hypothetical protein
MFRVLTGKNGKETLYFYESVLVKERVAKRERSYCPIHIDGKELYLVDGFSSPKHLEQVLEGFCAGRRWDFIGFVGSFFGISGEAEVRIKSLKSLFAPKEEPTANYIYRCRGTVTLGETKKRFDIAIKKFLPRSPLDRGNREFQLAEVLQSDLVPRVHGAMVNHSHQIDNSPQVLVLFSDFIEGANIGIEFWNLMLEIDRKKESRRSYRAEIKKLLQAMKEVSEKVIYPFHKSLHDLWRSFSPSVRIPTDSHARYFEEFQRGIETLTKAGMLDRKDAKRYSTIFRKAWEKILIKLEATEIHADLMWSQILRTKRGELVVLDLDEHMLAHPSKDLADLCAANRFLVESLPCKHKELLRSVAERMSKALVSAYGAKAKKWKKQIKNSLPVYLALRHLHDAAYHLPIWMGTTDPRVRMRHKKYVDLSVEWFHKSMQELEKSLEGS